MASHFRSRSHPCCSDVLVDGDRKTPVSQWTFTSLLWLQSDGTKLIQNGIVFATLTYSTLLSVFSSLSCVRGHMVHSGHSTCRRSFEIIGYKRAACSDQSWLRNLP